MGVNRNSHELLSENKTRFFHCILLSHRHNFIGYIDQVSLNEQENLNLQYFMHTDADEYQVEYSTTKFILSQYTCQLVFF